MKTPNEILLNITSQSSKYQVQSIASLKNEDEEETAESNFIGKAIKEQVRHEISTAVNHETLNNDQENLLLAEKIDLFKKILKELQAINQRAGETSRIDCLKVLLFY